MTVYNQYLISLLHKTFVCKNEYNFLTKLDVIAAFHKLQMHSEGKNLTMFMTYFGVFKYNLQLFDLTNDPAIY